RNRGAQPERRKVCAVLLEFGNTEKTKGGSICRLSRRCGIQCRIAGLTIPVLIFSTTAVVGLDFGGSLLSISRRRGTSRCAAANREKSGWSFTARSSYTFNY